MRPWVLPRRGQLLEQFNDQRAAFGGKAVEMLPVGVGAKRVAQGLEWIGVGQGVQQSQDFHWLR